LLRKPKTILKKGGIMMEKFKFFRFIAVIILFAVSSTGCSAALISYYSYDSKLKPLVGKLSMGEALIKYGNPYQRLEDPDYIALIYHSFEGGSVAITNVDRGFLTGQPIAQTSYVDTTHGCTVILAFRKTDQILAVYGLKDCK